MAEKSLLLRIKANVDDAKKGIGEVGRGLAGMMSGTTGGLDKFTTGAAGAFHGIKSALNDIAPIAEQALHMTQRIVETMQFAAQRQEFMGRVSADTLARMKVATLGVVGETRLMEVAARSATGEWAITRNELEAVSRASLVLAKQTLRPVDDVLEDITESLRTGTTKGLKEYGLTIDQSKGKSAAFREALQKLAQVAADAGTVVADAGDNIDSSMTKIANAADTAKEIAGNALIGLKDIAGAVADAFAYAAHAIGDAGVTGAVKDNRSAVDRAHDSWNDLNTTLGGSGFALVRHNISKTTSALESQRDELLEYNRVVAAGKAATEAHAEAVAKASVLEAKMWADVREAAQGAQRKRFEAYGEEIRERKRLAEEAERETEKRRTRIAKETSERVIGLWRTAWDVVEAEEQNAISFAADEARRLVLEASAMIADHAAQAMGTLGQLESQRKAQRAAFDALGKSADEARKIVEKEREAADAAAKARTAAHPWLQQREDVLAYKHSLEQLATDGFGGLASAAGTAFATLISGQEGASASFKEAAREIFANLANQLWGNAALATGKALLDSFWNPAAAATEWAAAGAFTAGALAMSALSGVAGAPGGGGGGGGGSSAPPRTNTDSVGQGARSEVTQVTNNYNLGYGFVGSPGELIRELEKRRQDAHLTGAVRPARGVERR